MKIIFITLSNIGDVIMSLPALDKLIACCPKAEFTVVCGERAAGLFEGSLFVKRVVIYNKQKGLAGKINLFQQLNKDRYILVVDLKNTILPLLLSAEFKTYPWDKAPVTIAHMTDRFLCRIEKFTRSMPNEAGLNIKNSLSIGPEERSRIAEVLDSTPITTNDKLAVISAGARSHIKRWPADKFAKLADRLITELGFKVILVGDKDDIPVCDSVEKNMKNSAANLCSKTTLKTLAALLERASLVVSNDSAVMHLASYVDVPTLAVFGPTDENKYGPWSQKNSVVKSYLDCRPCMNAQCASSELACMEKIEVEEVFEAAKRLVSSH